MPFLDIFKGKEPISSKLIKKISDAITPEPIKIEEPSTKHGICWGGRIGNAALPHKSANYHFAFVGATGSGKTVSIRLLLQTVLPFIRYSYLDHKALIYDAKQDVISVLRGMQLDCEIKTLNPFDEQGVGWNIAEDVTERIHAFEISAILVPPEKNSQQPFFGDATRHILEGVLTSFILSADKNWTFRDVVYSMGAIDRIIEVLNRHEETRELIPLYFQHEEVSKNIMSTIATKLKPYKVIASLWSNAKEQVSLREWLNLDEKGQLTTDTENINTNNFILVLGNDETAREAIDRLNQVILKRATQLILSMPDLHFQKDTYISENTLRDGEIDRRRIWIVLDEIRNAGKLELTPLLTKARSKGVAIVLGFQDIDGLRSVYGKEEADELVGQCNNFAIFKLNSPETAEWASRLVGSSEVLEIYTDKSDSTTQGVTRSPDGTSVTDSVTWSNSRRTAYRESKDILPAQFIYIPPTNKENGLFGFYLSQFIERPYGVTIPPEHLFIDNGKDKVWLKSIDSNYKMTRRGKECQKLAVWSSQDRERLGLKKVLEFDPKKRENRRQTIEELKGFSEKLKEIANEFAEVVFYRDSEITTEETEELNSIHPKAFMEFQKILKRLKAQSENSIEEGTSKVVFAVENMKRTK